MTLKAYGMAYPCSRAVKGPDYIHLYEAEKRIVNIQGVRDFSPYSLLDDDEKALEFEAPEPDEITCLQLALVELYEEVLGV